jgi:thiol-disulfide isomerase/thioredoxin
MVRRLLPFPTMNTIVVVPESANGTRQARRRIRRTRLAMALATAALSVLLAGCDGMMSRLKELAERARQGQAQAEGTITIDSDEALLSMREALMGKTVAEVETAFGKPPSVIETGKDTLWCYSRWRVRFNGDKQVVDLFRDVASTSAGLDSQMAEPSDRPATKSAKAKPSNPAADAGELTVVSNGGQAVDLQPLLAEGKVTIVDFYADWCGPCRSIGPQLEQLARQDPHVVLVKVNIAKWGTPVTSQYSITSVPNIRVFDRTKNQVGEPTSNLNAVRGYVKRAKG